MKIPVFRKKIDNIMRANQQQKQRKRVVAGSIDPKRLSKVVTSKSIFKKKKQEKDGKDYFISILVDASGSMEGDRQDLSLESIKKLSESFEGIKGLHYEIVAFSNEEIMLKDYSEKFDYEKVCKTYNFCNGQGSKMINLYNKKEMKMDVVIFEQIFEREYRRACEKKYEEEGKEYYEVKDWIIGKGILSEQQEKKVISGEIELSDMNYLGSTSYSQAILNSYYRMGKQTGKKVLLVMTDGAESVHGCIAKITDIFTSNNKNNELWKSSDSYFIPSYENFRKENIENGYNGNNGFDGYYNEYYNFYKNYIEKYGNKKGIVTHCLGIQTEIKDINHFSNHSVIRNLDELFPVMVKILGKYFKKG